MHRIIIWFLTIILSACQHHPTGALYHLAKTNNLTWRTLETEQHRIIILRSSIEGAIVSKNQESAKSLNIYIEGDGIPWEKKLFPVHTNSKTTYTHSPSLNPTSQTLLSLQLMLQDPSPSIYLNRPCYGFREMPSQCTNKLWTSGRYSLEVVHAMNQSLDLIKEREEIDHFTLIGHSGGGTLAALLANRRQDVTRVITLAGNFNHDAWTQYFHYDPLIDSLNPVDEFPMSEKIKRWHLFGDKDEVVPVGIFEQAIKQEADSATVIRYPDFDHSCCWLKAWPSILQKINGQNTHASKRL